MAGNSGQAGRSVVSKFSAILMTFRHGGEHNLSEIANLSGLPISTAHRMVNDLADWQVLEKDCDSRTYRPGLALQSLSRPGCCWDRSPRDRAAPWLEDMHRAVGANVRLGVLRMGAVRYIEKRGKSAVSQFSPAATLPAHATASGKVLLAFMSDCELRPILARRLTAFTPRTIVEVDQLRWTLKKARTNGFAVTDRELRSDCSSIAAPVFGARGRILAALEVDIEGSESAAAALDSVRPALSVAAAGLSRDFERPCENCRKLVAGGELEHDLASTILDPRLHRTRGTARQPSIADAGSIEQLDRQHVAGRSAAAK